MNLKRKSLVIISISLISAFLTSCSFVPTFKPYQYDVVDNDNHEEIVKENYYKLGNYKDFSYVNESNVDTKIGSALDVHRYKNAHVAMNTTGESKLLVIPVDFVDCTCENIRVKPEDYFTNLENAFFGETAANRYESVASYFDKSSYGKLKIKGKVVHEFFRSPLSVAEMSRLTDKQDTIKIYKAAIEWYASKYNDIAEYYVNGVDDKQGLPVYLVYTQPSTSSNDSLFWAYTFMSGYLFSWSSYSSMNLDYRNLPDTHTFIHETGHLLSLDDYYNTSKNGKFGPTGRIDMMDYSIGDETAYSKMVLDWTRPYVVNGSGSITIKSFESSGDLILINNNWNQTVLDEYLLIELYTPAYLNEYDSQYGNYSAILPQNPGIKIYHVDSRVGYFNKIGQNKFLGLVGEVECPKSNYYLSIAYNNSSTSNTLYHLLENHDKNTFKNGAMATIDTMWYANEDFGITCYKDFKFNNGNDLGYTFTVDSLNGAQATLTFKSK